MFQEMLHRIPCYGRFKVVNDAETIFKKKRGDSFLLVSIYVDDSLNCHNDPSLYRDFRKKFEQRFKIKTSDNVDMFLGISVSRDRVKKTITLHQQHYIEDCLKKFGLSDCKPVDTPMKASRLSAKDQPETINSAAQALYRKMVGSLLYLASWTRPDIAFAVSELSRFVSNPGDAHLTAAKRVFRYLKNTKSDGITYRLDVDDFPPLCGDSLIAIGLVVQIRVALLLAMFSSSMERSFLGNLSVSRLWHFLLQRPSILQALLWFKKILIFENWFITLVFRSLALLPFVRTTRRA